MTGSAEGENRLVAGPLAVARLVVALLGFARAPRCSSSPGGAAIGVALKLVPPQGP
jgi:hypothetical protein